MREVGEEPGWRCRQLKPLLTVGYRFARGGVPVSKKVQWYWMEPVEKVGEPDAGEILAARWIAAKDAPRMLKYQSDFELLEAWVKQHGE